MSHSELGELMGQGPSWPTFVRVLMIAGCILLAFISAAVTADGAEASTILVEGPVFEGGNLPDGSNSTADPAALETEFSASAEAPLYLAVAIDNSGSLSSADFDREREAVRTLISLIGSSDQIAIYGFNENVTVVQTFTSDKNRALKAINAYTFTGGGTALYNALYRAIGDTAATAGRKAVVVMTDGKDGQIGRSESEVIALAQRYGIPIYTVAFGSADAESLINIASDTGGLFFDSGTAQNLRTIVEVLGGRFASRPILFVHGFCSDDTTWDSMIEKLKRDHPDWFEGETARWQFGQNGAFPTSGASNSRVHTIRFRNNGSPSPLDKQAVNDVPIQNLAYQLKGVVEAILNATGSTSLDIVSHSMGGLVTRAYLEGFALDDQGSLHDYVGAPVRRVITLDTPHAGVADALFWLSVPSILIEYPCFVESSNQKTQMSLDRFFNDPSLLGLNTRPLPESIDLTAIAARSIGSDNDVIVTFESQDITNIPLYNCKENIRTIEYVDASAILHLDILKFDRTAALVDRILTSDSTASECRQINPNPSIVEVPFAALNVVRTIGLRFFGVFGKESSADSECLVTVRARSSGGTVLATKQVPATGYQEVVLGPFAEADWDIEISASCSVSAAVTVESVVGDSTPACPSRAPAANQIFASHTCPGGGCETSESIQFSADGFGYQFQACDSFLWQFGDGSTSTSKNPTHRYALPGTYTVSLTVTNSLGSATVSVILQVGEGSIFRFLVPGVISADGANSSKWRTDVLGFIPNVSAQNPATLDVSFSGCTIVGSVCVPSTRSKTVVIDTSTFIIEDFFKAAIDQAGGSGIVIVEGDSPNVPQMWTRTYNVSSGGLGTYGQLIPALALFGQQPSGQDVASLQLGGLQNSERFRTNVGFVNPTSSPVVLEATVFEGGFGLPLGSFDVYLQPLSVEQRNITQWFPALPFDVKRFSIQTSNSSGAPVYVYASMIDNISNDPVLIPAIPAGELRDVASRQLVVPGVGRFGSWRSDLTIYNPGSTTTSIDLTYRDSTGARRAEATSLIIPAKGTLGIDDLLRSGVLTPVLREDSIGTLEVSVRVASDLSPVVFARTYNDQQTAGTYGQGIPAFARSESNVVTGIPAYLPGVRNDSAYYTNLGFVSLSAGTTVVRVTLFDPLTGEAVALRTYELPPLQSTIIPRVLSDFLFSTVSHGTLKIEVASGGPIWAYGSIIDRTTFDPEYIPAAKFLEGTESLPPIGVNFTFSPSNPVAGTTAVSFSGSQAGGDPATSWTWNFGDGSTGTGQNVFHTFLTPGAFTVTVTATNAGGSFSASKAVVVQAGSSPQEITINLPGNVPLVLVKIPKGTFQMGSPATERRRGAGETPHEVTLTQDFYLGKYEVTQRQWKAVMGTAMPTSCENLGVGDDYPVYCVSWNDVCGGSPCKSSSFVGKLNQLLGTTKFRLPTEAEWERAARAGAATSQPFSFGDDASCSMDSCSASCPVFDQYMWWCGNAVGTSHPFGQRKPNGYGLYDMHGNMWEWVQDWFGSYPSGAVVDPNGAPTGSNRVVRGGGWDSAARSCRSANRNAASPVHRGGVGFRLARSQ